MLLFIFGVEEAVVNNGCKKREHNIMKPPFIVSMRRGTKTDLGI